MNAEPATKKQTLAELVAELRRALWEVEALEGELYPELEAHLDELDAAIETKVDRCLGLAQEFEAKSDVHKERAAIQTKAAATLSNQARRLRDYVKVSMITAEIPKLATENFPRVRLAKVAPSVLVDELVFIPHAVSQGEEDLLRRSDPKPDKKAIKERLKAGEEIPGCEMGPEGVSLRWK